MSIQHPEHRLWRAVNMRPKIGTDRDAVRGCLIEQHKRMVRHIADNRDQVSAKWIARMKRCALALLVDAQQVEEYGTTPLSEYVDA